MMKLLLLILFITSINAFCNMSSPVKRGTILGNPFTSKYVDVVREDINIKIDSVFETAKFEILYHIKTSKSGVNIPFLFYASDFKGDFKISIDNKPIKLLPIPDYLTVPDNTKFKDFSYFFSTQNHSFAEESKSVLIQDNPNGGFYVDFKEFLFFETNISKGEHVIIATYTADKWTEGWNWVNEYSFRYALSPAKYWKSFGTLKIKVDATESKKKLTSNLGKSKTGDLNSIAIWEFNDLPTEILKIVFIPEINKTAKLLIYIGPFKLALSVGLFLFIIHISLIYFYRKRHPQKHFSWVVIVGSLFFPLLFFISWILFYTIIDTIIGEHASRRHGYQEMVIILYPIVMPLYWLVMWQADTFIKKK